MNIYKKIYALLGYIIKLLLVVFLVIVVVACFLNIPSKYMGNHAETEGPTITYILIDGLSNDVFSRLVSENKLPVIQNFISEGLHVENGIGSFSSMTGYAFYPFITGMDAHRSDILGLRWFDRSRTQGNFRNYVGRTNVLMNQDINKEYQNYFETFDQYYTASINCYMNRGVHHNVKTGWGVTTSKYQDLSMFSALRKIPFVGKKWIKNHFEH